MYTNYEGFKKYLLDNAKDPALVLPNLELIRPLFAFVEANHYPFGRVENLDLEEVAGIISLAIGKPVKKVASISPPQPCVRSEWTTEVVHYNLFCDMLENNFGVIPWDKLYYDGLEANFDNNFRQVLWENFLNILKDSSWDTFFDAFRQTFFNNVAFNLRRNQSSSLLYFFSFVLAGDTKKIEQLTPLIKLILHGYIPMGSMPDDPETMLIFTV